MRTRFIVAIAALIAASALVAGPGSVGARQASVAQTVDAAQFRAVEIATPTGSPAASISTSDTANRSAGWLGPGTALAESADSAAIIGSRPTTPQPTVKPTRVSKNPWTFDPNISWYGPGMYGHGTACGVKLTRTIIGVASRTLPCGTIVTFRNPANGKVVRAPVIDRGPYVWGRTWDMSAGLCAALRHCYTGTILWKIGG